MHLVPFHRSCDSQLAGERLGILADARQRAFVETERDLNHALSTLLRTPTTGLTSLTVAEMVTLGTTIVALVRRQAPRSSRWPSVHSFAVLNVLALAQK